MRWMRPKPWWPLTLPPLLLLPGIGGFPYSSATARFSDFAISHFPNALQIQRSLLQTGLPPLWSDAILSGYPFYADPLSGLHYPPGWLALLFPLPMGMNLTALLHVLLGGIGMLLFLRLLGLGQAAALLGALAFQLMPKLWAHYGAGHLSLFYAFMWLPWLLWAGMGGRRGLAQPALFLALMFLADPRAAAYGGLLWLFHEFAHSHNAKNTIVKLTVQGALAGCLAAPLALPLAAFTRISTRAEMVAADGLALSLPPGRLLGLFLPDFGGAAEWMLYPGSVVLALALAGLLARPRLVLFWVATTVVALGWALGEALPFAELLARLPGISLLRVPPRAVFLAGFALAVLAAQGMQALMDLLPKGAVRRVRLGWVGLAAMLFLLAGGLGWATGRLNMNYIWPLLLNLLVLSLGFVYLAGRLAAGRFVFGLTALLVADLLAMNATVFVMRPAAEVLSEGRAAGGWLVAQPGDFRVYSPSYSIPQHTAADLGLRLADGVNPLILAEYAEYMDSATGVPRPGYSLTVPPFDGDPAIANAAYLPDGLLLAQLGVRYLASEFPLESPDLQLVHQFGSTHLYENRVSAARSAAPVPPGGFPPELALGLVLAGAGVAGLVILNRGKSEL